MTTIAGDTAKLRALDEDVSRAWREYSEASRALSREDYEQSEPELWRALEARLRQLDRRRRVLTEAHG